MANPGNPANANMYAANNAAANNGLNGMPAAGHHSDMQTLMQNMETLSGWLQQNREDFMRVQEGLEAVERRNARQPLGLPSLPSAGINGDASANASSPTDSQAPTMTSLQRELDAARSRVQALEEQNKEHQRLQATYEDTMTEATERLRTYMSQQSLHLTSLHTHYTTLLSQSRAETVSAQNLHYEWQASLSNLNEELKKAVKAREEEKDPFRAQVAALKEENRVLRSLAGWDPADDEEEDEGVAGVEGLGGGTGSGRGRGVRQTERVLGEVMGAPAGR